MIFLVLRPVSRLKSIVPCGRAATEKRVPIQAATSSGTSANTQCFSSTLPSTRFAYLARLDWM
eukprot:8441006-Pyramimonas_sp.AAC.1